MDSTWSRVVLTLALVLAAAALAASVVQIVHANNDTSSSGTARTITAQGHGAVLVKPDQATLTLGVQTKSAQVSSALSENTQKLDAVITAVEKAGVPADHLQTRDLSMYFDNQANVYNVTNNLTVSLNSADNVGSMLETATNAGANSTWGVSFSIKDPGAFRSQALSQALADARKRADSVASTLGLSITGVHAESDTSPTTAQPISGGGFGGGGGPSVQPGLLQVTADVTVTYDVR